MNRTSSSASKTISLLLVVPAFSLAATPSVVVSYTLTSPEISLYEPAVLRVEVKNDSSGRIAFNLGYDRKQNFVLDVTQPNGAATFGISRPLVDGLHGAGEISLDQGDSFSQTIVLNEWTDFAEIGTYVIDITLMTEVESASGESFVLPRSRTVLRVRPRDQARLSQVCEDLVSRIEATGSVEEYRQLAQALRFVRDPIAVPFLERALQSGKYVEQQAIHGLEQIGNIDAVRVLISVLVEGADVPLNADTTVGTRTVLADQALHRILRETEDPLVKREIESGIALFRELQSEQ